MVVIGHRSGFHIYGIVVVISKSIRRVHIWNGWVSFFMVV